MRAAAMWPRPPWPAISWPYLGERIARGQARARSFRKVDGHKLSSSVASISVSHGRARRSHASPADCRLPTATNKLINTHAQTTLGRPPPLPQLLRVVRSARLGGRRPG
jgi:hypothetical protein